MSEDVKNNKCVYIFFDHRKTGTFIYGDLVFNNEPIYVGKGNLDRVIKSIEKSTIK